MSGNPKGKVCSKCGKWKPLAEFHKHPRAKYGKQPRCVECRSAYMSDYRSKNHDAILAYNRKYYLDNKDSFLKYREEHREVILAYNKDYQPQYRARNRNKRSAYTRQYYANHREERLAYRRKYCVKNPDILRVNKINRRTRETGSGGSFTAEEWQALCDKYDNRCLCCGSEGPLTVDHIIPVSKRGTSDISNLQPLCHPCNIKKYNKIIDYR